MVDVDKSQRPVLSSRNKSYISEIRYHSRDSVIARSRVTEALDKINPQDYAKLCHKIIIAV